MFTRLADIRILINNDVVMKERVTRAGSEMLDQSFTLSYHSDPRLMRAVDAAQAQC